MEIQKENREKSIAKIKELTKTQVKKPKPVDREMEDLSSDSEEADGDAVMKPAPIKAKEHVNKNTVAPSKLENKRS